MEIKTIGKINENPTQHSTDAPSEGGGKQQQKKTIILMC